MRTLFNRGLPWFSLPLRSGRARSAAHLLPVDAAERGPPPTTPAAPAEPGAQRKEGITRGKGCFFPTVVGISQRRPVTPLQPHLSPSRSGNGGGHQPAPQHAPPTPALPPHEDPPRTRNPEHPAPPGRGASELRSTTSGASPRAPPCAPRAICAPRLERKYLYTSKRGAHREGRRRISCSIIRGREREPLPLVLYPPILDQDGTMSVLFADHGTESTSKKGLLCL